MPKNTKKPKIFLGNNISAKAKSATFWTGMIPVIATFVVSVCRLLGIDITEDIITQYQAICTLIISALTGFGVLVSHDTKGASDSPMVKTFNKPRDYTKLENSIEYSNTVESNSNNLKQELGVLQPKEYDTSEPFTDDSDEYEAEFTNEGGGSPDNLTKEQLDNTSEEALKDDKNSQVLEEPSTIIKEVSDK